MSARTTPAAGPSRPTGGPWREWKASTCPISDKGYRYEADGSADGIRTILLKGSDTDRAKIVLKGKVVNLPDLHPPLALPVTVQLRNIETNVCWSSTFTAANPNASGKLKAKTP